MEDSKQQEQAQQPKPRRVDIVKFGEILQQRKPVIRRFSIDPNHYAADVPEMLKLCYKAEVEKRGRSYRDDEPTQQHIASVAKWLVGENSRKPGLFLYGGVGNGKTTMTEAMRTLIGLLYGNEYRYEDRKGVVSVSALELAQIAKDEDGGRMKHLKETELLHIDDVGTEPASVKVWGNEVSPLVEILYSRYDRMLYTVITSNLTDEDILPRYGDRIADRFREMFDFLSIENKSYR